MPSDMKNPPIKRHPALQPFSRDHYIGLVAAQRLIRAAQEAPAERTARIRYFLRAWDSEIAAHFSDEERLLTPFLDPAQLQRLLQEHGRLRAIAAEATASSRQEAAWCQQAGQTLQDHIRWEERELFPAIERQANAGQLSWIEEQSRQFEATRPRSRNAANADWNLHAPPDSAP